MDAKTRETPTLQKRKSADFSKLSRTYSTAAMLPIDENPLQKTLDRIAEKQAELAKTKDCFNNNYQTSKDANIEKCKVSSSTCHQNISHQTEIMKQQQIILDEAKTNLQKQQQQEEKLNLNEKTLTLPFNSKVASKITNDMSGESTKINNASLIMKSPSVLIPTQSNKEPENFPRSEPQSPTPMNPQSGFFDFTKTPRSFLSSSNVSQPTPRPWTKFIHDESKVVIKSAPKLEFLGSEVTRKFSAPADTLEMKNTRKQLCSDMKEMASVESRPEVELLAEMEIGF